MSDNIRIRTTPNGTDNYLKVKIEQNFDFIEILSLKIGQDKVYQNFCSDYGVIVGRVTIGNGFGVQNAKVSVFIPVDDIDGQDPLIKSLYPYETVNDKNIDGIRYNLLPKESDSKDNCYTPVGTFPSKREILDNKEISYVYCKYYKFTVTTNHAGDFMIFGVPLGQQIVHVDADVSNIGPASQRPYDLIADGTSDKLFYSPTKFKGGKNLNALPQVKSANAGVNVQPFWGDPETCEIGITRVDIDLNYNVKPSAIFIGGAFGDSGYNSVNKRCRPRRKLGQLCEQITKDGTIEMIRKTIDDEIESYDIDGGRVIDENGAWAYQVPMNLDYVITNEFGDIVPSEDTNRGIPTRARVRFRVSMDESGSTAKKRVRGKYLVPHNPKTLNDLDFTFDERTKDHSFRDIYWNKVYTVKNFIARFERSALRKRGKAYLGIKDVDACVGDKVPMPYSRALTKINPLFSIICIIINIIAVIVLAINEFLCFLRGIGFSIAVISWYPFKGIKPIGLPCTGGDQDKIYNVGCDDKLKDYMQCMATVLADALNMFQFDFYNEWINGSLYFYLLKYKKRKKGRVKFCENECVTISSTTVGTYGGTGYNVCKLNQLVDTTFDTQNLQEQFGILNGVLVQYEDNLYYPPITLRGENRLLYPTDIVNLGAVFDCDWQGLPRIIQLLSDSSYEIPPQFDESPEPEDSPDDQIYTSGIVHLFFDIDCFGLYYDKKKAQNIRRQCELGVDVPESSSGIPEYIGIDQIYDQNDPADVIFSPLRYVRDSFCLLNIIGPSISTYPPIPVTTTMLQDKTQGTSFNINNTWVPTPSNNGKLYMQFRNFLGNNPLGFSGLDNSFYMYFGLIPGKTGIDKFFQKYYSECISTEKTSFIIDTTVTNTQQNGSSDGSISFTFIGGTSPFTYTWVGISPTSYNFGPASATTSGTVSNLLAGTYEITAIDATGLIVVKQITVAGPPALSCAYYVLAYPSTQARADGKLTMLIEGGRPPYNVTATLANGQRLQLGPYSNSVNQTINNIPYGNNTFTVIDSDNPQGNCSKTIFVDSIPPLSLTITNVVNDNCDQDCIGSMNISVSGGTSPYTISATGPNNFNIPTGTPLSQALSSFSNLCAGVYTITASDVNSETDTKTAIVYRPVKPVISFNDITINNRKQCDKDFYHIKFKIEQCAPQTPYDLCGTAPYVLTYMLEGVIPVTTSTDANGVPFRVGVNEIKIQPQIGSALTLEVKDSQCKSNKLYLSEASIRRPIQNLSATYTQTSGTYNIVYNITGGQPPYTNRYSNPNDPFNYNAGSARSYVTSITDSVGCSISLQVTVV